MFDVADQLNVPSDQLSLVMGFSKDVALKLEDSIKAVVNSLGQGEIEYLPDSDSVPCGDRITDPDAKIEWLFSCEDSDLKSYELHVDGEYKEIKLFLLKPDPVNDRFGWSYMFYTNQIAQAQ